MSKITDNEFEVLDSWFEQDYGDFGTNGFNREQAARLTYDEFEKIHTETWRWAICEQHDPKSIAGIVSSLTKKDLVIPIKGGPGEECLEMTAWGFAAWQREYLANKNIAKQVNATNELNNAIYEIEGLTGVRFRSYHYPKIREILKRLK